MYIIVKRRMLCTQGASDCIYVSNIEHMFVNYCLFRAESPVCCFCLHKLRFSFFLLYITVTKYMIAKPLKKSTKDKGLILSSLFFQIFFFEGVVICCCNSFLSCLSFFFPVFYVLNK